MERIICDYCGMEFDARLTQCPLCGRNVSDTASLPRPEEIQAAQTEEEAPRKPRTEQSPRRVGYTGKRVRKKTAPQKAAPKQEPAWTGEEPDPNANPYAIPRWMMGLICFILALAVLGGALIMFTQVGWSPLYGMLDSPRTFFRKEAPAQTAQVRPASQQPAAQRGQSQPPSKGSLRGSFREERRSPACGEKIQR